MEEEMKIHGIQNFHKYVFVVNSSKKYYWQMNGAEQYGMLFLWLIL